MPDSDKEKRPAMPAPAPAPSLAPEPTPARRPMTAEGVADKAAKKDNPAY